MHHDLRDACAWKLCGSTSDIIFYGVGLCDDHYGLACSTFKTTYNYAVDRVVPEAAAQMRQQHLINTSTQD